MGRIELCEGDITEQAVDAIVNAANNDLKLGSGVAGAIRDRGGPTIQEECDALSPIDVGAAVATTAGQLPARYVIHAAGMAQGESATEASVRSAVRASLTLARELSCASIALPAIGAGVGGFSKQRCAEIMIEEARVHLGQDAPLGVIRFVLLGEPMYRLFEMTHDAAKVAEQMARLRKR